MAGNDKILEYQQDCYANYLESIGIQQQYIFPDGNPIRPLPPIQVKTHSLMIVGAYPSARFEQRSSHRYPGRFRLVPVANNLRPFGSERYFDGLKVRNLESAEGLNKYLLQPLQISAEQCWITDLVKVFLYKPEHIDSCSDAVPGFDRKANRANFPIYAEDSLPWLEREARLCEPRLIITLGLEVAQAVSGRKSSSADELLCGPIAHPRALGGAPTLYLPHPDACRRSRKWREMIGHSVQIAKSWLV
jgi:uracil-DNA glycosylase